MSRTSKYTWCLTSQCINEIRETRDEAIFINYIIVQDTSISVSVAQTIAKCPFTPGHEAVGEVGISIMYFQVNYFNGS